MEEATTRDQSMDKPLPLWLMLSLPIHAGGVLAIFVFLVANDWRWLEGWAYVLTLAANLAITLPIINKKNPRVLRNRMKLKKEGLTDATRRPARSDRFILPISAVGFFGTLIVPGLAHRFGWPSMPIALEIAGLVLSNVGLVIMNMALLQNPFASKLLDINKDQYLIDTGLYAHVRHPLYAGILLMTLTIPIALGSWWGLIPAAMAVLTLVVRIESEEEMLIKGMDGYWEYQTRVRYKLIPKVY
jgi:protein-S-isoprenylcysteine O-methyltransferase Ste14